ncbi:putative membrane protein YabM [Virgibacillus pantothenticus]|uniref:Low temperature requirement protein B n=1 Tax=Virgibacillus pantothenticus TaxID=1473 RepID=A0A0L0QR21_VIRPA|nr:MULTISPECIES: polysaccharide biosynthesis protein [Virgibacillus]API92321.1 low temperature requirement protein B [Virgibacillus sp. 6R]KNE21070.1 low temperature requirement protein B [Virgibacillus pantothenticus]MBS7427079.1 polysaccharide biosynthesis protein [Virgibacillus sp. 19R1-5]MED3736977.1 polysaccharide biosynthesis protein [Virgibacillus pantothenticus]QTY16516.1 polysaccharide biosynthesis protein [Virgibacillus pantothenticus]
MNGNKTNQLVKGALLLTITGVISKVLSAAYRIPLQNLTGDMGFYVYQQIYPILGIGLMLALYGFPSAISKLAADRQTHYQCLSLQSFYMPIFLILCLLSGSLFLFIYMNAPYIARWVGDDQLSETYRLGAFTFLFVPIIALLRGAFQGIFLMKPTAFSQLAEQLFRVTVIVAAAGLVTASGQQIYLIGKAAVFAAIIGLLAAGVVLGLFFWRLKPFQLEKQAYVLRDYVHTIIILGMVATLNHMVLLLLQFADTFTLFPSLLKGGYSKIVAMEAKGVFDRGQPLIQVGTVLGSSFALALMPSISKKKMAEQPDIFYPYIRGAMLFSIYLAAGATAGLMVIFPEVNQALFLDRQGNTTLRLLMSAILLSSLAITAASILQGLGHVKRVALIILLVFFIKWIGNQWLVPTFGIFGSSLATVLSLLVFSLVALVELHRKLPLLQLLRNIQWKALLIAILVMVSYLMIIKWLAYSWLTHSRAGWFVCVGFLSITGAAVYGYCLIRLQAFTEQQLQMLPSRLFLMLTRKNRSAADRNRKES